MVMPLPRVLLTNASRRGTAGVWHVNRIAPPKANSVLREQLWSERERSGLVSIIRALLAGLPGAAHNVHHAGQ